MSLKVIDGKQTEMGGLWWHPKQATFTSQTINLSQLREFKGNVRLIVKKNAFFKQGTDRPNYVFWLRDAKEDEALELSVEDVEEDDRKYTYDDLVACIRGACEDGRRGYDAYDLLPSDYIDA